MIFTSLNNLSEKIFLCILYQKVSAEKATTIQVKNSDSVNLDWVPFSGGFS